MSETDLDKEEKPHLEAFAECVKIEAKVRALIAVRKVFPVLPQSGRKLKTFGKGTKMPLPQ